MSVSFLFSALVSLALLSSPLSSLQLNFDYLPDDFESVSVELPEGYGFVGKEESLRSEKAAVAAGQQSPWHSDIAAPDNGAAAPIMLGIEMKFKDSRGVGYIPLSRGIGPGECLEIKFSDAAGKMFDSRFKLDYSIRSIDTGATLFTGEDYLSLWEYSLDAPALPTDTTRFYVNAAGQKMMAGRSMAFQFGSISQGFYDSHTDFRQTDNDFLAAAEVYAKNGFDHIRIPIDEGWCFFSNGDAKPDFKDKVIKLVDKVIGCGMRVIIDYHWMSSGLIVMPSETGHYRAYPSEQELRFRNVWRQLHEMFKDYAPEQLAYEIVNEADMGPGYDWNLFVERSVRMMRDWGGNELRRVIVCPCRQTNWEFLKEFKVPSGDPNLIATFHDYTPDPLNFYKNGHYRYRGPIHYPGRLVTDEELSTMSEQEYANTEYFRTQVWNKKELYRHMGNSFHYTRHLGVPVWVGEFGSELAAPYQDRLNYYRDVCEVFRHYGFSYAFWFEITRRPVEDPRSPDAEIIKAMIPDSYRRESFASVRIR